MDQHKHEHEGREVFKAFWPDTPDGSVRCLKSDDQTKLVFRSEYLGDHSENWILEITEGREMRRHNTRFLESILWVG